MRPRFSIRELILVTAIVGMTIGWWFDHTKLAADFRLSLDRGTDIAKERDAMETKMNQAIQGVRHKEFELRQLEASLNKQAKELRK